MSVILFDVSILNESLYTILPGTEEIFNKLMVRKSGIWTCASCGVQKKKKGHLQGHVEARCSKRDNYSCNLCDLKFRTMQTLKKHFKIIHNSSDSKDFE